MLQPISGSKKKINGRKKRRVRSKLPRRQTRKCLLGKNALHNEPLTESDLKMIRTETKEFNRFSRAKWATL